MYSMCVCGMLLHVGSVYSCKISYFVSLQRDGQVNIDSLLCQQWDPYSVQYMYYTSTYCISTVYTITCVYDICMMFITAVRERGREREREREGEGEGKRRRERTLVTQHMLVNMYLQAPCWWCSSCTIHTEQQLDVV